MISNFCRLGVAVLYLHRFKAVDLGSVFLRRFNCPASSAFLLVVVFLMIFPLLFSRPVEFYARGFLLALGCFFLDHLLAWALSVHCGADTVHLFCTFLLSPCARCFFSSRVPSSSRVSGGGSVFFILPQFVQSKVLGAGGCHHVCHFSRFLFSVGMVTCLFVASVAPSQLVWSPFFLVLFGGRLPGVLAVFVPPFQ